MLLRNDNRDCKFVVFRYIFALCDWSRHDFNISDGINKFSSVRLRHSTRVITPKWSLIYVYASATFEQQSEMELKNKFTALRRQFLSFYAASDDRNVDDCENYDLTYPAITLRRYSPHSLWREASWRKFVVYRSKGREHSHDVFPCHFT